MRCERIMDFLGEEGGKLIEIYHAIGKKCGKKNKGRDIYIGRGRQTKKKQGMNGKEKEVGGSNMGVSKRIPDSPKCPINELVENIQGFGRIKFYF